MAFASYLALLVVVPSLLHVGASPDLRGIDPADAAFYAQTPFVCRNGDRVASVGVNDDYCDCADGSDEPGTAACSNSVFFCPNKGYVSKTIPSAMVNDRICDCCDGSDEVGSSAQCANTCHELQVKASQGLRETLAKAREGQKINAEMRSKAEAVRAEKQAELDKAKEELAAQEVVVTEAEEKKNAAEAAENAERDRLKAEEEAANKDAEAEAETEGTDEATTDGGNGEAEVVGDPAVAEETAGAEAEAEAEEEEERAFPYPEEYRFEDDSDSSKRDEVNQQRFDILRLIRPKVNVDDYKMADDKTAWNEAKLAHEFKTELDIVFASVDDKAKFQLDCGAWDPAKLVGFLEKELDDYDDEEPGEPSEPKVTWQWYSDPDTPGAGSGGLYETYVEPFFAWVSKLFSPRARKSHKLPSGIAATEARNKYNDATRIKRELETKVTDVEKFLTNDFGPNDDFIHLHDQCFDRLVDKYTYEFCPFGNAAQKEGTSSTSLGKFDKWEVGEDGTRKMLFTGGQGCWQGPKRSLTVTMACGPANTVTSVAEPEKCTYEMDFETPHVCTDEVVAGLQAQLDALFAVQ